ncbi:hypothetical protein [Mycobacterium aquaticum]|uniref:Uncharacterized protein n=1 Tax=Mycobacterium aquaticum TaxID=1927124 RepID=A0A1X0A4D8_9MYCO|nr:hypothetical protein [Mycobacterium aquaticum]ORA24927.1 hypothetical protein BST13_33710 [Mycobacterium aquaticum]
MSADEPDLFDVLSGALDSREAASRRRSEYNARRAVRPDGHPLGPRESWCGRCGKTVPAYEMTINHDLGYLGCPTEFDPTWSKCEAAPGFRGVEGYPDPHGQLTESDLNDRWDRRYFADCTCGHAWGLHRQGEFCIAWCGCDAYEACGQLMTAEGIAALGVDMPLGDMGRPVTQRRGYRLRVNRIRTVSARGVYL